MQSAAEVMDHHVETIYERTGIANPYAHARQQKGLTNYIVIVI
jgi:hypothetical protein